MLTDHSADETIKRPSYGYLYFLCNAAVAGNIWVKPGECVKIGITDAPVRRLREIPVPIDLRRSWMVRFKDRKTALQVEALLHMRLDSHRRRGFATFACEERWERDQIISGHSEWFAHRAFKLAIQRLLQPEIRRLVPWDRLIPTLDLVPDKAVRTTDSTSIKSNNFQVLTQVATLQALGACRLDVRLPSAANDNSRSYILLPDNAATHRALASLLTLQFSDGRHVPVTGRLMHFAGNSLIAAELPCLSSDNIERARDFKSSRLVQDHLLGLPSVALTPAQRRAFLYETGLSKTGIIKTMSPKRPTLVHSQPTLSELLL